MVDVSPRQHGWKAHRDAKRDAAFSAGQLPAQSLSALRGMCPPDAASPNRSMKSFLRTNAALVLAAGFLLLFVSGGARFAIGLTLKPIVEEFGWGRSEVGSAVGLFQIVSAIVMFVAGRLVDRISLRAVLAGGIVISAIGIGLMSLLSAPWHALLLYGVVFAVGNGAVSMTPVGVMVTRAFPGRTGLANAAVMSGMSIGPLVRIAVLAVVLAGICWR